MNEYIKPIPESAKHIYLDIGLSYGAPQSQVWLTNTSDLFVFGFEPNPDCLECLRNGNIQAKRDFHGKQIEDRFLQNNMCIIPVALGNVPEPTESTFYQMADDCGTSSIYRPTNSDIGPVKCVTTVPMYSLKHFFDLFPWDRFEYIEYIKIDAQGCDYDILVGAGDYLKERVVYVTAEPEFFYWSDCNHNNAHNIISYMQSQGFEYIRHPNTNDPTFLNTKFNHLRDTFFIWQKG